MALDKTLSRHSRHDRLRRRTVAQGLLAQPVLHVADEGREPRPLQGQRARLSRRMEDERGAEASGPCARPQPLHRTRRQHLFPRQDRRDRRQELPADGGLHDRHDRAGISRHDDQGRPEDRGKPQDRRARRRPAPAEGRLASDSVHGPHHRLPLHLAHPRRRRRLRPRQDQGRLLEAGLRRIRFRQAMDEDAQARRDLSPSTTITPPPSVLR